MSPTPANDAAEVPQPLPATQQQDQFTEDYFRDDMAVFEVSLVPLPGSRLASH